MGVDVYDRHHDLVSLVDVDLPMKDRMSSYITHQSAGLALNGTDGGRPARQLSEEVRTCQPLTGAAVDDPTATSAAANGTVSEADLSPYQSAPLSRYNALELKRRVL
jgi:hypothetical protein